MSLLGWVEHIAQGITDEVEGEREQQDCRARNEDEPGCAREIGLVFEDDIAPGGRRRLHANAEEGQRRLQKNGGGDSERGPDDHRGKEMWQDMLEDDAGRTRTHRALGLDEIAFRERPGFRIEHARNLNPVDHGDHHRDDPEARLEYCGEYNGKQQSGEGHHEIGKSHQHGFHPATEISGANADSRTDEHRNTVGYHADDQRGLRTIDQAGEQIAPDEIGAEPEFQVGRERRAFQRQAVEELFVGIEGNDPRREERGCDSDNDDHKAESGQWSADDAAKNAAFGFFLADRKSVKRAHDRSLSAFRSESAGQRPRH